MFHLLDTSFKSLKQLLHKIKLWFCGDLGVGWELLLEPVDKEGHSEALPCISGGQPFLSEEICMQPLQSFLLLLFLPQLPPAVLPKGQQTEQTNLSQGGFLTQILTNEDQPPSS